MVIFHAGCPDFFDMDIDTCHQYLSIHVFQTKMDDIRKQTLTDARFELTKMQSISEICDYLLSDG